MRNTITVTIDANADEKISVNSQNFNLLILGDEKAMKKIFEPFFTTKADGTGLGLCLVRRLIEEIGGQIRVQTQWGQGSQFVITLPSMTAIEKEAG